MRQRNSTLALFGVAACAVIVSAIVSAVTMNVVRADMMRRIVELQIENHHLELRVLALEKERSPAKGDYPPEFPH